MGEATRETVWNGTDSETINAANNRHRDHAPRDGGRDERGESPGSLSPDLHRAIVGGLRAGLAHCGRKGSAREQLEIELTVQLADQKLADPKILRKIQQAENPNSYAWSTARNFAIGQLRKLELVVTSKPLDGDRIADDQRDELAERDSRLEPLQREIERLDVEKRLLLGVVYADVLELSRDDLEQLARRRGLEVGELKGQLVARREGQRAARAALQEKLDDAWEALCRKQNKINHLEHIIAERDGRGVEPARGLDASDSARLRGSTEQLEHATKAERAWLRDRYYEELEQITVRQRKLQQKAESIFPGRPRWDEVAEILGVLPPGASEAERATAVNRLTVKATRLRKELMTKLGG